MKLPCKSYRVGSVVQAPVRAKVDSSASILMTFWRIEMSEPKKCLSDLMSQFSYVEHRFPYIEQQLLFDA